ncbi:MAG: histidine kinase dimerization/phospho-acceptor domain-containing protein [Sulfurovum sp.]|nr:histidine kinase dimerization/phospho-acceptor domain-containing protein [Sulfurovum sp.]
MSEERVVELDKRIQSIEYARETKNLFFANISHEIRTPMNAVIGLSHILLDYDLDSKHRDYVSKIETSANLILNIVNDILDFSKMEAGKFSIEKIEFDMNGILENISTMIDFKAYEKKNRFNF